MDAERRHSDDLTDLERRLAGWRPAGDGLDADAMLFAAGRAAARPGRGRIAWPVAAGCLALVAAALGAQLRVERSERLALLRELDRAAPAVGVPADLSPAPSEPLAPDGYLMIRRQVERDADAWLSRAAVSAASAPSASPPPILRAGMNDGVLIP